MKYTFEKLENDLKNLIKAYPFIRWGSIGKSVWGRELYYIKLGYGNKRISYNGAHHGMEYITSAMLMGFVSDFMYAMQSGKPLGGYNVKELCGKASLYIIPMLNPDGVELAAKGIPEFLDKNSRTKLVEYNNGSSDFSRWQANANGVDLNHNYDAMWHLSKAMEKSYGINGPGATRYSGGAPLSEPESRALAEFTSRQDFETIIAFHSQGKVIYQGFMGKEPDVSHRIAKAFEIISPYRIDKTQGIASYGGYKDWFVNEFRRPGYTVEVGEGKNPLPDENLPIIYKETLPILLGAMTV